MRAGLLAIALAAAACGATPPERQLLTDFFRAARLHDTTALANVATVTFNPRRDGIVERFEIVSIEEEQPDTKQVTVAAAVRTADGETATRRMAFRIARGADGRWMITGLRHF